MDITQYAKQKAAGTARVLKIDGKLHLSFRQFDTATGEPTSALVPLDIAEVTTIRDGVKANLDSIELLLVDIEKPKVV